MTAKQLRICIICPHFPPNDFACGVGDYTGHVVDELLKIGHDITVLSSTLHHTQPKTDRLIVAPFTRTFGCMAGFRFLLLIRKNSFDLINMQHTPALYGFWFRVAVCFAGFITPVIVTFHTLHGSTIFSKAQALMLLALSRGFISTNEEITRILKQTPFIRKDFAQIPIGANIVPLGQRPDRRQAKRSLNLPEECLVIANFGLFYPGRGIETLLRACHSLKIKTGHFRLLLLGALREIDHTYITLVQNLVRELGLDTHVVLTGDLEPKAVSAHLSTADIYCVPFDKGASIRRTTLITAIEHGLATVTTTAAIPSAYLNDKSGAFCFVPAQNPEVLAETLWQLWNNSLRRETLETRIIALRPAFAWGSIGRDLNRELHRILAK
ncbi:MAG: hypothetical protein A2350_10290 [Candidatus Raymondbacteria bacterium RifOxyB12_full_50_8]|uniref:Glycosyltransferase subfamily 4-like N-terminal domain-containing protein n=1 Tax=Candidatus Raymondbacteria bacterium RIFOXYD12_FULL_49_13 TaxID=1817890 RepID=A0A1F7F235_UNCRA|nr:MAG: hypothetical protein A2248_07615 [Candidatus Raymondbacteria bacterium RIFOXYA2_FULL_49_16]OGJ96135.1 MAG: hypothetical protein A2453_09470 [Candidatus Raymondbacteria bacterium RIFOXYC2_FULL_50_21]OGK00597.1 MAG: hypothetical protein A2519_21680 [Candidatus Raymondbacteria bacterium RIFOXYD12_FULL_49_13]OGK03252.1 MAG: hypothetical protein A2350_10290 [Candidatus Raymondbacteria bacterium RifOxyB12_full_50_8]OGP41142.1 MAG: hypothetical protein A2324_09865 [Candidatus Raymondbacteria b